jgi:hypothetical protein
LGRRADSGTVDPRFLLRETPSRNYAARTRWNVRDSDATVIFTLGPDLRGGSRFTRDCALALGKPWLHLAAADPLAPPADRLLRFLREHDVATLNLAGPRESTEPGIGRFVTRVLDEAFLPDLSPPDPVPGTD